MESTVFYSDIRSGINYFNIDSVILDALIQTKEFKEEYNISSKNFKHVENKIILHNLFQNILSLLKNNNINTDYKPVLYVSDKMMETNELKSEIVLKQLKLLKKLLPIPVIIPLSDSIFIGFEGPLKELNYKCLEFFCKRKIKLKELKRYFTEKGYSTLSNALSSTVNLKGLYY
jgi:hypothetical protein